MRRAHRTNTKKSKPERKLESCWNSINMRQGDKLTRDEMPCEMKKRTSKKKKKQMPLHAGKYHRANRSL